MDHTKNWCWILRWLHETTHSAPVASFDRSHRLFRWRYQRTALDNNSPDHVHDSSNDHHNHTRIHNHDGTCNHHNSTGIHNHDDAVRGVLRCQSSVLS